MDLIDAASFYSKYGSHSSNYGCFSRHWQSNSSLICSQGYDLVLAARQPERLSAVAQEVQTLGRAALSVPTDVRDPDQVNTLVHKALEQYGAIDVLVNNAGIYISDQWSSSPQRLASGCTPNFWGMSTQFRRYLHFLERGTGTIVNLSSIGAKCLCLT